MSAAITMPRPGRATVATIAMLRRMPGNAMRMSTTRMTSSSTTPRKYPAMTPSVTPMKAQLRTTMTDSVSAERAPCMSCDSASTPFSSVPSQCSIDGDRNCGVWSMASTPTG